MLDLKIAGGQVLDGTGASAERIDVDVTGDTITAVGDPAMRARIRDEMANGAVLARGMG